MVVAAAVVATRKKPVPENPEIVFVVLRPLFLTRRAARSFYLPFTRRISMRSLCSSDVVFDVAHAFVVAIDTKSLFVLLRVLYLELCF